MTERQKATPDTEVSPMEAQNEGQRRRGSPSDGPLPKTKTSEAEKSEEAARTSTRKGGEGKSRDDL